MPPPVLIIADDLTGAADTAARFAGRGVPAAIGFSLYPDFFALDPAIAVLAVDTESRHLTPAAAFRRIVSLVKYAGEKGVRRYYKKIDSTFRGNVGAELEALMLCRRATRLPLVPAYPKGGRTTVGGRQYVNGRALGETFFARDPRERATESDIAAIVRKQTRVPVYNVGCGAERGSGFDRRSGIFVFDALTDEDLFGIGALLEEERSLDVVAGAAGFAELLPGLFRLPASPPAPPPRFGPLLVVNGSLNDVALEQIAGARRDGIPCRLVSRDMADAGEKTLRLAESLACDLALTGCAIVTTAIAADDPREGPGDGCSRAAAAVTAAVAALLPGMTVAAFGGDTAYSVCRARGITELFPADEITPGLTVCSIRAAAGDAMILKSGGFGPPDAIGRIREYVGNATSPEGPRGPPP